MEKFIEIKWCVSDVQCVRADLTDEQSWKVLLLVKKYHDATVGISWDTIEAAAHQLFGEVAQESLD